MEKLETILNQAAEYYGIPRSNLSALRGGHFTYVYGFSREGRDYVLRITPPNTEIDLQATRAILEFMHFLSARGVAVPRPTQSQRRQLVELIEDNNQVYQVVVFEAAAGILSEELPPEQWTDDLFESLGRTVGKMHAAAQAYVPVDESRRRPDWDRIVNCFKPPYHLDPVLVPIYEQREKILTSLQALPKDKENYGLIHADLHFANFFVDVENCRITLFDFDDCVYGWYVMDTAMLLFDLLVLHSGADREAFAARFMRCYLRGYRQEKLLDPFWISQLPLFLKLLEIGIYLLVYPEYNPDDADPWLDKFMPGRKERIEAEIPYTDLKFDTFALQRGNRRTRLGPGD